MIYKYLEKKIEMGPVESLNGKEKYFELEYYLLETDSRYDESGSNNMAMGESSRKSKAYGLEIVKKDSTKYSENNRMENLFCNKDSAREIIDRLARNTVTPVGLKAVLEDIIGSQG